jgi:chromosome segregation ATPase
MTEQTHNATVAELKNKSEDATKSEQTKTKECREKIREIENQTTQYNELVKHVEQTRIEFQRQLDAKERELADTNKTIVSLTKKATQLDLLQMTVADIQQNASTETEANNKLQQQLNAVEQKCQRQEDEIHALQDEIRTREELHKTAMTSKEEGMQNTHREHENEKSSLQEQNKQLVEENKAASTKHPSKAVKLEKLHQWGLVHTFRTPGPVGPVSSSRQPVQQA